jgi:hypothetical protein
MSKELRGLGSCTTDEQVTGGSATATEGGREWQVQGEIGWPSAVRGIRPLTESKSDRCYGLTVLRFIVQYFDREVDYDLSFGLDRLTVLQVGLEPPLAHC